MHSLPPRLTGGSSRRGLNPRAGHLPPSPTYQRVAPACSTARFLAAFDFVRQHPWTEMIPSISLTDGAYAFLRNSDVMAQAFRPYIYQAYLGNMPVDSAGDGLICL